MPPAGHRHRGSGFPMAKILAIVIGVHVVGGLGFTWLAKTTAGQELAKKYNIKLFAPPKPPEQAKQEPPPPPPPPPKTQDTAPPPTATAAPKIASAAPPPSAVPMIGGGGGGGPNWAGGKFLGAGLGDGPEGAYRASVIARFRKHYEDNKQEFGNAELRLAVNRQGAVTGYRLTQSSGNADNDRAILEAAARLQQEGAGPPPADKGAIVTVRLYPSY
jgi:TonB family protein